MIAKQSMPELPGVGNSRFEQHKSEFHRRLAGTVNIYTSASNSRKGLELKACGGFAEGQVRGQVVEDGVADGVGKRRDGI
ncbi:MAG: hypothetical protein PVS2B2_22930 [Candidatus Acidiferrum sp.]